MESLPTYSIVIPTYKRPGALRLTLAAIAHLDYPTDKLQILVVDDGGEFETSRVVEEAEVGAVDLTYLSQENSGAATARNRGARAAEGELLLFCDDDILIDPNHLDLDRKTREQYAGALVNGALEFSGQAIETFQRSPFGRYRLRLDAMYQAEADGPLLEGSWFAAEFLSACNLSIQKSAFWELGGFDEAFPYAGAEDQALSLEARAAGLPLVRNHEIRVRHNDQILSFRQFCAREERSAQTFVLLVDRYPNQAARPLFAENAPVSREDSRLSATKKLAKSLLSRKNVLRALHALVPPLERVAPERALGSMYRLLLGLHIHRGVGIALRRTEPFSREATNARRHRQAARAKQATERLGLTRVPGFGRASDRLRGFLFPSLRGEGPELIEMHGLELEIPREAIPVYLHRPYEPGTTRALLDAVGPGSVVVDVGANLGYYSCLAARAVGPAGVVHALEPTPATADRLRANLARNSLDNAHVYEVAAAAEAGERQFALTESSGANSFYSNHPHSQTISVTTVRTVRLDDLIDGPVNVMKIDAEGAEPEVLAGMHDLLARSAGLRIFIEWNPRCLVAAGFDPDLATLLRRTGFIELTVLDDLTDRTGVAIDEFAPDVHGDYAFEHVNITARVPE